MTRSPRAQRASALVPQLLLMGPVPLALVWLQDWYVDVNAPNCGSGSGTQADPFCDIMDAVAAAADGDTIHIAPGTYFENVGIDKDLAFIGTGGHEVTILDGCAGGSVVHVLDSVVTLTGLTLTNGTGTWSPAAYEYYGGGLVAVGGARVTLTSCTVSENTADNGGGLFCAQQVDVIDSIVVDNLARGSGGGVSARYMYARGSTFARNQVGYGTFTGVGGGLFASSAHVTDSIIEQNTAIGANAGVGGGIHVASNPLASPQFLILINSTVTENVAGSRGFGGGIYCGTPNGHSFIEGCVVSRNEAHHGSHLTSFGEAGGILSWAPGGSITITNSVVCDNNADGGYFGGVLHQGGALTVINTTVTGNYYSGIGVSSTVTASVSNSVLWEPVPILASGSITVGHSVVQGGWPGAGNLDADPLFVDPLNGDYRLLPGSPCIDAGDNSAVPFGLTLDIRGYPRFMDDLSAPDTGVGFAPIVDMGAYERPPGRQARNARGVPTPFAPPRSVP